MKNPIPTYSPNTPKRLLQKAHRAKWKFHTLADRLGVNVKYLYDLMKKGIEPTNPEIRKKLFLPRIPKQSRKPVSNPLPVEVKWWRRQSKEFRQSIIRMEYNHRKERE